MWFAMSQPSRLLSAMASLSHLTSARSCIRRSITREAIFFSSRISNEYARETHSGLAVLRSFPSLGSWFLLTWRLTRREWFPRQCRIGTGKRRSRLRSAPEHGRRIPVAMPTFEDLLEIQAQEE